ncbi:MAG: dihydropteroate synthase, partial [Elusimicrobia bacterium]|nr:dihydropteroate synthase [Elusimicrobiota bacterium]
MIIRKVKINSPKEAQDFIKTTACDDYAVKLLSKKAVPQVFVIENLDNRAANILKQEALSCGADVAVSSDISRFKKGVSKVVLVGSTRNIERLLDKLSLQPFGLKALKANIEAINLKRAKLLKHATGKLNYSKKPLIMGILNLDPNSFSGQYAKTPEEALQTALNLQRNGADIIDLGAATSRPGSKAIGVKEELKRLIPVLKLISKKVKIPISVDTFEPEVAKAVLGTGASIINDIYGLRKKGMAKVVASAKAGVVIMHMQGTPSTMQKNPKYNDVVGEIFGFLHKQIHFALEQGIEKDRIASDPGIGFGKTLEHNYTLLKHLNTFKSLNTAVVGAFSRKSLISNVIGTKDNAVLDAHTV